MPALGYFYYKRSGGGRQSGKNMKESARFLSHSPRIPLFGKELEKSGKLCYNRSIMRNGRHSLSAVQNYEIFVKFHQEVGIMAEKSGVQSVERIFQLIEHLAAHPTGVSLQRLAEETGLAKSTVHRLLASLVGLGYVVQDEENGHYRLTLKMFELSSGIVDSMDIMGVAKAHLERLSQRTGEAVHLVIRDGRDIVYIYKTESGPMRMSSRVGLRSPLYCTGVGKAILATLPGDELEDIWTHSNVQKLTDKTITDLEELRSQPFVSQQSDVDADIQSYFKKNDLHVSSRCYIVDDQSMIAMVACGQGLALMPELMFKEGAASAGCQVLQLEPAAKRTIGLACLSRTALSPAAREFVEHARAFARKR